MKKNLTNEQIKKEFGKHLTVVLKKMCLWVKVEFDDIDFAEDRWFMKHEWSEEEQDAFKEWFTDYLYKNAEARRELTDISYRNKRQLRKAAEMFCFQFGWKFSKTPELDKERERLYVKGRED